MLQSPEGNEVSGQGAFTLARRRFQTGQLIERGDVWVGRWREDVVMPNGTLQKRVRRSEVLGTKEELPTKRLASRALQSRLERINSLVYRPTVNISFREFANRWQTSVLPQHKKATQHNVKSRIKNWLDPFFGDYRLDQITPELVQRFAAQDVTPATIRGCLSYLGMIWNSAMAWGYTTMNVMEGIRWPRAKRIKKLIPFTPAEAKQIVEAAKEPYRTLYWLLAETGMRIGEALGLHKSDFDLERRQVTVLRSVYRCSEQTPKTENAVRRFPLSEPLRDHLEVFLKDKKELLFPSRNNKPKDQGYILQHQFHPLLDKLEIERRGFHSFRHGNASLLDSIGAPVAVRLNRLGHAEFDTTLIYTHQVSQDELKVADELGKVLGFGHYWTQPEAQAHP